MTGPNKSGTDAPSSVLPPSDHGASSWHSLFSLAKRQADDRRAMSAQLLSWCENHVDASAAVFAEQDGRFVQLAASHDGVPSPSDSPGEPWSILSLPDVAIVHRGGGVDDRLMLVATCARISQLKQLLQAESFQAMFRGVELEALYEVGLAIASTLDLDRVGEEVLLRAVLLLDARRGALYLTDGDRRYQRVSQLGGDALEAFGAEDFDISQLVAGKATPPQILPGAAHLLASAVEIDGKPRGLLVVGDKESRTGVGPFPVKDRRTLSLLANQAAIALENAKLHRLALEKERLEREMELAAEIQKQLLPKIMPTIPGFEVIGWNRPARHVGGDYFEFEPLGDDRWGIVVGDVTGKGMPAALLVSTLHSALRLLLDRMEVGPTLVERLNRHIFESSGANKFITLILASLDCSKASLGYINAGHNPGVLVRASGEVLELSSSGLPLGLMGQASYVDSTLVLDHGDLVCIYSDGITECESPEDEEYGLDRLTALLSQHADQPLTKILAVIDKTMLDWARGLPQGDDQTVVMLRRK